MLDVSRLDVVQCTTALEVQLLAALVHERRERMKLMQPPPPKPKPVKVIEPPPPPPPPPPRPSRPAFKAGIKRIQIAVAKRFGYTLNELISDHRQRELVLARQVAVMLCYALTPHGYPFIGRWFSRDHTTMLHSVNQLRDIHDALCAELNREDPLEEWVERAYLKALAGRAKPAEPVEKAECEAPILDIAAERASLAGSSESTPCLTSNG